MNYKTCAAAFISATAAACAVGMLAAPTAAAGPAPGGVEQDYVDVLDGAGISTAGATGEALQLAYLSCALQQTGGGVINGAEPYLAAAEIAGLCDYVSVEPGQSPASLRRQMDVNFNQGNIPSVNDWTDSDIDDDDVSNSNDGSPFDDNYR